MEQESFPTRVGLKRSKKSAVQSPNQDSTRLINRALILTFYQKKFKSGQTLDLAIHKLCC